MPRAAAPLGLRSAAFRCYVRFPSTSFSREVEGKLYDGPSSLLRKVPLRLTLFTSVEFPLLPAVEQGAEGTTKAQVSSGAASVAQRQHEA